MTRRTWILGVALLAGALAGPPRPVEAADDPAALAAEARAIDRAAATPGAERPLVERLARELNVPAATLRAERQQSRLGWGELVIAHRIAQATALPVERIIAERKTGKGWGQIAQAHDLKLGRVVSQVKQASQAAIAESRKAEKAAQAEREKEKAKSEAAARSEKATGDRAGGGRSGDAGGRGGDKGGGPGGDKGGGPGGDKGGGADGGGGGGKGK